MNDVTRIMQALEQGDTGATEELLPLVYEELRALAAQKMAQEKPGQTLQATALVHEAYIRLVGTEEQAWDSRGHFFKAAAEAMRRILVENARKKNAVRHGGDRQRVNLTDTILTTVAEEELIALHEALGRLEEEDEAIAALVKLRYFVGLTLEQAAQAMGISERTGYRHWAYARARLHEELGEKGKGHC